MTTLCLVALGAAGAQVAVRYWPEFRDREILGDGLFALKEVQMFGSFQGVSRAELLLRSGIAEGQNLLALDLDHVKRDVEMIPYVESVAVERILPHLLRLRVVERTPVARVKVFRMADDAGEAGSPNYLDRHGAVMPARFNVTPPRDPFADRDLPMITGVSARDIRPGDRVADPAVEWAIAFVGRYERAPVRRLTALRSVDVAERGVLRVTLANGARVVIGPRDPDRQLLRLGLLHEVGAEHGQRLLEVDLSVENNCPSLWMPEGTAAVETDATQNLVDHSPSDV
ncbi:MAG: FtsQ-type POTRA domain-containing protein [Verrucomicrobiae bacterium]|nr:FtsQ-type POTRA domain-containing protein [Verrucomicrobiae bacterium]